MRYVRVAGAFVLTFCATGAAWAQDARKEAADLFRAGRAAYERHEYRAAALAFEEAYRRVPRGATLYNAGLAWEEAGEAPRAADAYRAAMDDRSLDEPSRNDANGRLATLEKSVGMVRVVEPVGESVAVGHIQSATIPLTVHLTPGSYPVNLTTAGKSSGTKTVVVAAGQTTLVAFERPSPPLPQSVGPSAPDATPSPGSTMRLLGWIGVGSALAFSGAAVGLGLGAVDRAHAFDASGNTDTAARSSALTLRTLTNVAWGAAAVTGAAGILCFVLAPRSQRLSGAARAPFGFELGAGVVDGWVHF